MMKRTFKKPQTQSGNIFFMLFAAVALVGGFGVAANNMMKGMVSSMSDVTRKTIAEEKMAGGARLSIQQATVGSDAGDCDADDLVEPLPFVDAAGLAHPAGGGHLPQDIGATMKDPWGTPYGYCAWDPGTAQDAAGCGGPGANRLAGSSSASATVVAVISAGKDRKFSTSCNAATTAQDCSGLGSEFYNDPVTGHCYYRNPTNLDWAQAQAACQANGGYLAAITSSAEGDILMNNFTVTDVAFIGLDDLGTEGTWQYSTGELAGQTFWTGTGSGAPVGGLYNRWHTGEPNANDASENCGATFVNGWGHTTAAWVDYPCDAPRSSICEVPLQSSGVTKADGSDDLVMEYTYTDASGLSEDDLWKIRDTKPDTATISKDIEVTGGATMQGILELKERGLLLPEDTDTGPCTALNEAELRVNGSASPPVLEICYDSAWVPISMGSGGGGNACGASWTARSSSTNLGPPSDIAYGNNTYVIAAGYPGYFATSPDGITWTDRTAPANFSNPNSIAFGNGTFVAIANDDTVRAATSTDGITWTGRTIPANQWTSVTYGNGVFVAVSPQGVATSPDGITWTTQTAPAGNWSWVTYGYGRFVAIQNPPGPSMTSTDNGVSWTIGSDNDAPYNRISYAGNGTFVGSVNGEFRLSTDGLNWDIVAAAGGNWYGIVHTASRIVGIGFNTNNVATSTDDGATFQVSASMPSTLDLVGITQGPNMLVAVGPNTSTNSIITSACADEIFDPSAEAPATVIATLPDPLVRYNLDETAGTVVTDIMGTYNGTLTGATSPPSIVGMIGRAFDLDGSNDRIVSSPAPLVQNASRLTLSAWVYPTDAGTEQVLFSTRDSGARGFSLHREDAAPYRLVLQTGDGSTWISTGGLPSGAWVHIAVAFDTDFMTTAPAFYINGVESPVASATPLAGFSSTTNAYFAVGAGYFGTDPWPGYLDDFRIYSQILNADQIRTLYYDRDSTAFVAPNASAILAANKYRGKISSTGQTTCSVLDDGSAWCWGREVTGSMGNGSVSTANCQTPCRVETGTTTNGFVQISTGMNFSCGIKVDGTAWCWGDDAAGQLGNGATAGTQHTPSAVSSIGTNRWTQISAGDGHACGLQSDGNIYCWGDNGTGQLGSAGGGSTSPRLIAESGPWASIAVSGASCAIKTNGSAWCWGSTQSGRVGNGSTTAGGTLPTQVVEPGPWIKISRQNFTTCGIKLDGSAWCWGGNSYGTMGNGTSGSTNTGNPKRVNDPGPWLDIESSQYSNHVCGIKMDGTMWCWGDDGSGQIGNGSTVTSQQRTPARVLDPGPWGAVSVSESGTCGIKVDGSAWCWGDDTYGQLGNGTVLTANQHVPSRVANFAQPAPFSMNDAQTILTKNSNAATISLNSNGGRIGFDGNSGGFGFTGSGRSILANPNGNSGLSIESTGAFDSQISWKTVTAAATRSIGVDNVTGNLEFGVNNAAVTNWMSAITPQMVITSSGNLGVGTQTPALKLDVGTGGVRVGADTRDCTLSRKGVLRLSSGVLQFCNGSAWTGF